LIAGIPGFPPNDLGGGRSCLGVNEVQFLIFDIGSIIIVNWAATFEFIVAKVVRVNRMKLRSSQCRIFLFGRLILSLFIFSPKEVILRTLIFMNLIELDTAI
jgi:hypothetical protein